MSSRPEVHELTGIFVFEIVLRQNLLPPIVYDVNEDGRKGRTKARIAHERFSIFLCFMYRTTLEPLLLV
jgi:hypothetical protein